MNTPDKSYDGSDFHALDDAFSGLRGNPDFWQEGIDSAFDHLLALTPLLPLDEAQLWQFESDLTTLRLRHSSHRAAAKTAPVDPAYLTVLRRARPFAGDGFAGPAAAKSLLGWRGAMHLAVAVEGQLWGVLVLERRATAWRELDLYRADAVAGLVTQLIYAHRTRHAEQRFQALTRQAPIGILHYNEQGTVLYRNEYLVELL